MSRDVLNVAVVGAGYWGKNLVRNFATAKRCNLKSVCDLDEDILAGHKRDFPFIDVSTKLDEILNDAQIDAVVIATEAAAHFEVANKALQARKHTYVEKPLTLRAPDAEVLINTAKQNKVKLMVGHLLQYHPAVTYMKSIIDSGEIGKPLYMYTQRVNLGIVRQNENAWWSLAPHDISVICYLFDSEPISVTARGQCYLQEGIEDLVFATVSFANGNFANIHCSWLDPHKIRKMTVVGSGKMVTFDDMEANEKVRIYDKSAQVENGANAYAEIVSLRFGNILIPKIEGGEPLAHECAHFINSVLDDKPIISDGLDGLRVVKILEAGGKSLESGGFPVNIGELECRSRKDILPMNRRISISPVKSAKAPESGTFHM
jgi:predicted dehydrogenase